jgi:hypothetical protein
MPSTSHATTSTAIGIIRSARKPSPWSNSSRTGPNTKTRCRDLILGTYRPADEADEDKALLAELLAALNASPSVLRRNDASPKPRASV